MGDFIKTFKTEVSKIVWPDSKTVLRMTVIVIFVSFLLTLIVYGLDYMGVNLYSLIKTTLEK